MDAAEPGARRSSSDRQEGEGSVAGELSLREASAWLGLSERTLRRAIARGEIEASRLNGAYYVRASLLAEYRARLSLPVPARPVDELPAVQPPAPVALHTALHVAPPQPVSRLIGRHRELARAQELVLQPAQRLLTLTGPGGVGKTRLALAVAAALHDRFADGVAFVDLAPVRSPGLAGAAIARALGVREVGNRSIVQGIVTHLQHQDLLLLLDNFEHLLPAAPLVSQLLMGCPALRVLVTSRAPLHLDGERLLVVPPLSLPEGLTGVKLALPVDHPGTAADVASADAVRLFVERVQAVRSDFALTETNAPVVAQICDRLDGLPLAIELAAARCRILSPQALLPRLERSLPLLTDGLRGVTSRHSSLAEAIAWSHDLLAPDERIAFRRLAVFAGGFTLEAAERVIAGEGSSSLDLVAALHAQSLLTRQENPDGEVRFGMLETVREFALDALVASGEADAIRRRHAEYFLTAAEGVNRLLPRPGDWWVTFEREWSNFEVALAWAAESGEAGLGLRLGGALFGYWMLRGGIAEGIAWLERLLAVAESEPATVRGRGATALGFLYWFAGDLAQAQDLAEQSLALAESEGDALGAAVSHFLQGFLAEARSDLAVAAILLQEARERYDAVNAATGSAAVAAHLGRILWRLGEPTKGKALLQEAVAGLDRETGGDWGADLAYGDLALIAVAEGNSAQAANLVERGLRHQAEIGDQFAILLTVTAAARIIATWDGLIAATLLGAVTSLRERAGPSLWAVARPVYEEASGLSRGKLGDRQYSATWDDGRLLQSEEAISLALRTLRAAGLGNSPMTQQGGRVHIALTPRELAVMRQVVAGHTDQEIAVALRMNVRTVNAHVANVRRKLGVPSRAAAAAEVARLGLG